MDADGQFLIAVFRTIATAVVGVALTIGGCVAYENKLITEMTARGVDPIDAKCGINSGNSHDQCLLRAAVRSEVTTSKAK